MVAALWVQCVAGAYAAWGALIVSDELARWLPVIVALLTIGGGALVYGYQKRLDRHNQILAERRTLYRDFVRAVGNYHNHIIDGSDLAQSQSRYGDLVAELTVSAPDTVVSALKSLDLSTWKLRRKFEDYDSEDQTQAEVLREVSERLDKTITAMRRDSFENTSILGVEMTPWSVNLVIGEGNKNR